MKVAVIYNKQVIEDSDVINVFGMRTKEWYNLDIVEKVASSLEFGGHNVRTIEGNMHVIDELQTFMPRVVLGERPGMVFNMAYGIQGQSRYTHIPSMLEMLGIPYVGSNPAGHAIALDKVMSKIVFMRHNVPTPAFWVFTEATEDLKDVRYPVIVKPRMEAVSFGIRLVKRETELREAIEIITKEFHQQALVEEFIPGREFAVAILGNGAHIETLPIVEIDFEGDPNGFQTADDKATHPKRKICPADLSPPLAEKMRKLALEAFNSLGLCDFARVDFRMDPEEKLQILEINSMASLNQTGSFVLAAQVAGLDFGELVNRILDIAAVRYFGQSYRKNAEIEDLSTKKSELLHVRVRSYLRSHLSTIVDHISHMVSISTHVHNIEGVNTLGNWLSNRFHQLGFSRRIYTQVEAGNILYFANHEDEQNDILILGHMDTVYDYMNHIPFREEHGRIYGSGAADAKGGLAITIAALQALKFARVLKNIRCGVLLTSDDSLGGRFSGEIVTENALHSRYVVGTKYGDIQGGIVLSCAGTQHYHIEITNIKNGKAKTTANVVKSIAEKCIAWMKLSSSQKGIAVKIDSLTSQTNVGSVADHATVSMTVNFKKKEQISKIDDEIRQIAEKVPNGGLQARIRVDECRMPVSETRANRLFFENVSALAEILEVRIEPIHRGISSDICHVPENVPALEGFGPVGGDAPSPNEFIVRDSLLDRGVLLAVVIYESAQQRGST